MKRSRYFLASVVFGFISTGITFGQDTVSPIPRPSSPVIEGVVALRISDSLPPSGSGWGAATTGRPGVNSDPAFSPIFGQDGVSFGLNLLLVAPTHPGGTVVFPQPSSPVFGSGLTLRVWDSLPTSDSGWATATTGGPGLFSFFRVGPPPLDVAANGGVKVRIQGESSPRGRVPFPPIPPVPANPDSGFAAVPEPSTWGLIAVGAAVLLDGRRRRR
jgi:hypothetical protein